MDSAASEMASDKPINVRVHFKSLKCGGLARYIHVLVPCPLGWASAANETIGLARLAVETGIFPVFEAEHGTVSAVSRIRSRVPVEEYLRPQGRYRHLFKPELRADLIARIQAMADRNIARYGLV